MDEYSKPEFEQPINELGGSERVDENEVDNSFEFTGKTVAITKKTIIEFVWDLIDKNDPDYPHPLTDNLYMKINGKTIMVPHDIQNEAIATYTPNNREKNTLTKKIEDYSVVNYFDDPDKKEKKKRKNKNKNINYIYLIILIVVLASLWYGHNHGYKRF